MRTRTWLAAVATVAIVTSFGSAELRTRAVEYREGDTTLEGYLAWDDGVDEPRPAVIVVHEWYGLNAYARQRTRELARLGYVAFAADIYGKGRLAENRSQARELSSRFRENRGLLRRRAKAALRQVRSLTLVDRRRVAAIGFCFGGTTVLELARSGADLQGVVSFHGGLGTPDPNDARQMEAAVLVLHGAADPGVGPDEVAAFFGEMSQVEVNWRFVAYGGVVHAFTNPEVGDDPSKGVAYDAEATAHAFHEMRIFLNETIGKAPLAKDDTGVGEFIEGKIVKPTVKAGKTAGEAAKKAAGWTVDKITGDD